MHTNRTLLFVCLVLAIALLFVGIQVQAQSTAREQWEYLFVDYIIRVDFLPLSSAYLNRVPYEFEGTVYDLYASLGADGWEYVGVVDDSNLFKRRM